MLKAPFLGAFFILLYNQIATNESIKKLAIWHFMLK